MKSLIIFFMISFISSSALSVSFKTASAKDLDSRQLIGKWTSGKSQVNIYCSGAMDYKMDTGFTIYDGSQKSCEGCSVHKIKGDHIVLGPIVMTKLKISKWPFDEDGQMKMVVENTTFTRSSYPGPCK